MASEQKRACGYRKVGGLYLCADGFGVACCKLPIMLHVCPTCGGGIKQGRGWQWINPLPWLAGDNLKACLDRAKAAWCPLENTKVLGERVGLLWIGTQFYPTPQHFAAEAAAMGISKRISAVPRGFKLGEHWVFLAHPKVRRFKVVDPQTGEDRDEWQAGVFHVFKPQRIEKIVTDYSDLDEMAKLTKAGIIPVAVGTDPHHQGTVYDDETEELQL